MCKNQICTFYDEVENNVYFSIHLNMCGQVENYKWIFCSRKTGVQCAYLRFLKYKNFCITESFIIRTFHISFLTTQ